MCVCVCVRARTATAATCFSFYQNKKKKEKEKRKQIPGCCGGGKRETEWATAATCFQFYQNKKKKEKRKRKKKKEKNTGVLRRREERDWMGNCSHVSRASRRYGTLLSFTCVD